MFEKLDLKASLKEIELRENRPLVYVQGKMDNHW
jgi:hypothetical protein